MSEQLLFEGKIIKGIGGFYYLMDKNGRVHECKAKGRFRKDGITPLVGDNVLFSKSGLIEEIKPRKNELRRPRVSNIDVSAIVVSAEKPEIDFLLCDKLIIAAKYVSAEPLIIINKNDAAEPEKITLIKDEYRNVCKTFCVSAKTGEGVDPLKSYLSDKCTCFAGQSAAGKSSLINSLFPGLNLETGNLSKKIDRGMHTTRQTQFLVFEGFPGSLLDTPGFSSFDAESILPEDLSKYYDDMAPFEHNCRFTKCMHLNEPDCGVKDAVNIGLISNTRYKRYLDILKEIKEKRLTTYD